VGSKLREGRLTQFATAALACGTGQKDGLRYKRGVWREI